MSSSTSPSKKIHLVGILSGHYGQNDLTLYFLVDDHVLYLFDGTV